MCVVIKRTGINIKPCRHTESIVAFIGFLITCKSIFEIIIIELRGKAIHWYLKAIVPISKTSFSPLLKSIIISGANIIPKILTTSRNKNENFTQNL